ncbi:MAG TPA: hypothetical protein DCE55_12285 [Planctomycetaceae bacterium]|nr:hypothetical protein [Planctomycetaceae bacterium]
MPAPNAIEKRIDQIETLWTEFTEQPEARLLRWLADADNVQMIDVFLDKENEEVGSVPDMFLIFRNPFENPENYAAELRAELQRQYQDVQAGLAEAGIQDDWQAPATASPPSANLLATYASFHQHHSEWMELLVLVLAPETVSDRTAWQTWLTQLLEQTVDPGLRFMVVDDPHQPALATLASQQDRQVVTIELDVNLPAAYNELVRAIPGTGPGFTFRQLFVSLTNAAADGNVAAAERLAARAAEIARQQQWPTLIAAVNMTLGATYFAQGDAAKTLECYRGAGQAVAAAETQDEATRKVAVQTKFSEGSILFGESHYAAAAEVFAQGSQLATEAEDDFQVMEGWRMAAFCHEQDGQLAASWEASQRALAAAAQLDAELRRETTLPYLGAGLLRLTETEQYQEHREELQAKLNELMDIDWERKLTLGTPN